MDPSNAADRKALVDRINERAKVYEERPETRPDGFAVRSRVHAFQPYALREACLEAAAAGLAPDWDIDIAHFIDRPPELMLGMYRGS